MRKRRPYRHLAHAVPGPDVPKMGAGHGRNDARDVVAKRDAFAGESEEEEIASFHEPARDLAISGRVVENQRVEARRVGARNEA